MDMKNSREEEILTHLSEMDEELLDTAYSVDSPEKLREYIKSDSNKRRISVIKPAFYKAAALAACFVFIIVAMVHNFEDMIPSSQSPSYNTPSYNNGLPTYGDDHSSDSKYPLYVDSISSLNYYCAMAAINESCSTNYADVISDSVGSKIYYYELDPNEKFTVTRVIFFQVEIKNKNGFLASKIGTGIVDVVITENNLEPMITFKNGNRYFSCCENTLLKNGKLYSTHKFIEGFYLVKNLEQENYSFSVEYDNFSLEYTDATARSVNCASYKNGGERPDGKLNVVSATYIYNNSAEFTIADLEEYFNTVKFPENTSEDSQTEKPPVSEEPALISEIYSNGIYEFEFYSDGTFIYYSAGGSESAVYRKGTYSHNRDSTELILTFIYEENIVETTSCALTEANGFIYNGSEYVLSLSKEQA
jgi:hypothetical protein